VGVTYELKVSRSPGHSRKDLWVWVVVQDGVIVDMGDHISEQLAWRMGMKQMEKRRAR